MLEILIPGQSKTPYQEKNGHFKPEFFQSFHIGDMVMLYHHYMLVSMTFFL